MRFPSLTPLLALSLLSPVFAAPQLDVAEGALDVPKTTDEKAPASPADDPVVAGDTAAAPITDGGNADGGTTFNGHNVPPLTELTADTLDQDIASGYSYASNAKPEDE